MLAISVIIESNFQRTTRITMLKLSPEETLSGDLRCLPETRP